jgi:replication-associated recombination protein RarA
MSLADELRPDDFDDVVGQEATIKKLKFLQSRGGLSGRSYWFAGLSGTGKTTLARIIAGIVSPQFQEELDVGQCSVSRIAQWDAKTRCKPIDGTGWILVVNEAHGLKKDAIRHFLDVMERLPAYAAIVFTTTIEGQLSLFEDSLDASPLTSRCTVLELESKGEKLELAFAIYLRRISRERGLGDRPLPDYVALVRRHKFNLRACIQSLESGELL